MKKFALIYFLLAKSFCLFSQNYATIYFYRPKRLTSTGVDFKIYINQLEIGQIANGGRLEYRVYKSGRLNIMCGVFSEYTLSNDNYDNNFALDVTIGQSYYFKGGSKKLEAVPADEGKAEFSNSSRFLGSVVLYDAKPDVSFNQENSGVANPANNPEIKVSLPKIINDNDFITSHQSIKLLGYVKSNNDITLLKINNQTHNSDKEGNFSLVSPLKDGLNKITIYAETSNGLTVQKTISIIKEVSETVTQADTPVNVSQTAPEQFLSANSDVDVNIPVNPQTNINSFALIIANENYKYEAKVDYANNDGLIFKAYCEKTLGIPSSNIRFVSDATFGNMRSEINRLRDIIEVKNGNAKIIFYYAGHGVPDDATKNAFLLPVDAESNDPSSAYPLEDLFGNLNAEESKLVTVILDACFSGSARGNQMLASARGVKLKPKEVTATGNMVVLSATSGDETALPFNDKKHGIFTYYLLKKLQETSGKVSLSELYKSVNQNVREQSLIINNKKQTPQINFPSPEFGNKFLVD